MGVKAEGKPEVDEFELNTVGKLLPFSSSDHLSNSPCGAAGPQNTQTKLGFIACSEILYSAIKKNFINMR